MSGARSSICPRRTPRPANGHPASCGQVFFSLYLLRLPEHEGAVDNLGLTAIYLREQELSGEAMHGAVGSTRAQRVASTHPSKAEAASRAYGDQVGRNRFAEGASPRPFAGACFYMQKARRDCRRACRFGNVDVRLEAWGSQTPWRRLPAGSPAGTNSPATKSSAERSAPRGAGRSAWPGGRRGGELLSGGRAKENQL